ATWPLIVRRAPLRRKREADPRAAARAVLGPDAAAVRLDEAARDRQPEAGTAAAARSGCVAAPEAVEHPPHGLGREALARVLDREPHLRRAGLDADGDGAVARRVPQRVRDEVEENPL